jgi:hypothetical protein
MFLKRQIQYFDNKRSDLQLNIRDLPKPVFSEQTLLTLFRLGTDLVKQASKV